MSRRTCQESVTQDTSKTWWSGPRRSSLISASTGPVQNTEFQVDSGRRSTEALYSIASPARWRCSICLGAIVPCPNHFIVESRFRRSQSTRASFLLSGSAQGIRQPWWQGLSRVGPCRACWIKWLSGIGNHLGGRIRGLRAVCTVSPPHWGTRTSLELFTAMWSRRIFFLI